MLFLFYEDLFAVCLADVLHRGSGIVPAFAQTAFLSSSAAAPDLPAPMPACKSLCS
jgi:hypothetical protein